MLTMELIWLEQLKIFICLYFLIYQEQLTCQDDDHYERD